MSWDRTCFATRIAVFTTIFLMLLLKGTQADVKNCPSHCKCDQYDTYCSINNNTAVRLQAWFLNALVGSLIVTCQGTDFTCADLPQQYVRGARQFHSVQCPNTILACAKDMLIEPAVDTVILYNVTKPLTTEHVKDFNKAIFLSLRHQDTDVLAPISTINNWPSLLQVTIQKGHLHLVPDSFNHSSLGILYLESNKISNWTVNAFSGLPKLKKLALIDWTTDTDYMRAGTFKGLHTLQNLKIFKMPIKRIEVGAFEDTPKLEVMKLDLMPLESLQNGFLNGLESLKSIIVTCVPTENQPELDLGSHAFAHQSTLHEVELGYCKINNLPETLFSNSTSIGTIDIGDNLYLKSISPKIFSHLSTLAILKLNNNTLRELPDEIFANLKALKRLSLSHNHLTILQDNIFRDLTSLTTLNLDHNHIQALPEGIFSSLKSLEHLNLNNNDIQELPGKILVNVAPLMASNLNDSIKKRSGIFDNLVNLETLNLADNKIQNFHEDDFVLLSNVYKLNLTNNAVKELPESFLSRLKPVIVTIICC